LHSVAIAAVLVNGESMATMKYGDLERIGTEAAPQEGPFADGESEVAEASCGPQARSART
jgi:hypothetical protein